jgi:hypothetical protein
MMPEYVLIREYMRMHVIGKLRNDFAHRDQMAKEHRMWRSRLSHVRFSSIFSFYSNWVYSDLFVTDPAP